VIGGPPGSGKSRASVALAVAGATGQDWFGMPVHARFRTLIIQRENGRFRLSQEMADIDCDALDDHLRICEPPPFGLAFDRADFQEAVKREIEGFQPSVVLVDPWNAVAADDRQKDYLAAFEAVRAVLPVGDGAPALGIIAHTRKPKSDERATGRGLLNLLAGSYVLGSVPRCVFVLQPASDDPTDDRVVWTCCKNNDGELGPRTAWHRRNGLFAAATDFDWGAFDNNRAGRRVVDADDMSTVFLDGQRQCTRSMAVADLMKLTGLGKSACYEAVDPQGRFAGKLVQNGKLFTWTP
jgi:hypothetical protein